MTKNSEVLPTSEFFLAGVLDSTKEAEAESQ